MHPVGFYDLREAASSAVPVVSTAFRPIAAEELARNPFRVFTSMLTPADRAVLRAGPATQRLESFLAARHSSLPSCSTSPTGPNGTASSPGTTPTVPEPGDGGFELSREPVDRPGTRRWRRSPAVAADIGGVPSTHINHLTPRVLDIDELYRRMTDRGDRR